jgi:hypothetical protein
MHPRALIAVIFVTSLPALAGCVEEDAQAAYPQQQLPVGATTAPSSPQEEVAASQVPPVGAPPPPAEAPPPPPPYDAQQAQQAPVDDGYADTDPSALQDFRGTLSPYGTWQDDPTYGTVWVPSASVVGSDFTPYVSAGHWSYDDDQYVWVSDYDWGWAPFHYGRWVYGTPTGWAWIPGRRYAGAWVSWRYGMGDWGSYVGWAPLAPTWGWRSGVAFGYGFAPRMPYSFCASGELFAPRVGGVVIAGPQAGVVAANTRPWAAGAGGGRVTANPAVAGPPPSVLHIPATAVVSGAAANRGVVQARAFARPSTAMPLGGSTPRFAARPAQYPQVAPSHFGGRLGAGFSGAGAANGYSPRPYYGSGRYSTPMPSRGGYPAGRSFGGGGFGYRAPAAGGGWSGFHGAGGGGGFHGGGSFHGGGAAYHGGGGFHGGGGGRGGGRR